MITLNKGEWSEIYVFLKLLAEGKLYAADANRNKLPEIFHTVLSVVRSADDGNYEYLRNGSVRILNRSTEQEEGTVSFEEVAKNAADLLTRIKTSTGSFDIGNIAHFLLKMKVNRLKAHSTEKSDILLTVQDTKSKAIHTLGFSIKSRLGSASTLFNAQKATNFIFKIDGNISDALMNEINSIETDSKIMDRVRKLNSSGCSLLYSDVEGRILKNNLEIMDTNLPLILSELLVICYREEVRNLAATTQCLVSENFMDRTGDVKSFYELKIKNFLKDVALGMTPQKPWTGNYDATGGYIIVKEDGEVISYNHSNINEFLNYLFNNTFFESPSSDRHGYGKVYKEGRNYFFKLNLQVRFKQ